MIQYFLYSRYDLIACFDKHIVFRNIDLNGEDRILNAINNLLGFICIDSVVEIIEFEVPGKIRFGLKSKKDCTKEQFKEAVTKVQDEFERSQYDGWTATMILDKIQYLLKTSKHLKEKLFIGVTKKSEDEIKLKYYSKHRDIIYMKTSNRIIAHSVFSTLIDNGYEQLEEIDEARNIIIFSKSL